MARKARKTRGIVERKSVAITNPLNVGERERARNLVREDAARPPLVDNERLLIQQGLLDYDQLERDERTSHVQAGYILAALKRAGYTIVHHSEMPAPGLVLGDGDRDVLGNRRHR